MDKTYSNKLISLMRHQYLSVMRIIDYLLFIVIITALILAFLHFHEKEQGKLAYVNDQLADFDPFKNGEEYAKSNLLYMSKSFFTIEDETTNYHIAVSDNQSPFIIAVDKLEYNKHKGIIKDPKNNELPSKSMQFIGQSTLIEEELFLHIKDAYTDFLNDKDITLDSIKDEVGAYYLHTKYVPGKDYEMLYTILYVAGGFLILFCYFIYCDIVAENRRRLTLEAYNDGQLLFIDNQLNDSNTFVMKKGNLYITKEHIVSYFGGFNIIPLEDIVHVYGRGRLIKNTYSIMVKTKNGKISEIVHSDFTRTFNTVINELRVKLKSYPNIRFGFPYGMVYDESKSKNNKIDSSDIYINTSLGIIGSVMGSLIGTIPWILLSFISNIQGITGFIIMFLAIKCYEKCSGFMNRKGKIISVTIGAITIFLANYFTVAFEYCRYYLQEYNLNNILHAIPNSFSYLIELNRLEAYAYSLLFGYILATITAYITFDYIDIKQNKKNGR